MLWKEIQACEADVSAGRGLEVSKMLSGGDAKKISLQLGAFTAPPENQSLVASTHAGQPTAHNYL